MGVVCIPLSSKFLPESTGKNVKIGKCLAKIWNKYNSSLFWPTPYIHIIKKHGILLHDVPHRSRWQNIMSTSQIIRVVSSRTTNVIIDTKMTENKTLSYN